jgi:hypothetical protein
MFRYVGFLGSAAVHISTTSYCIDYDFCRQPTTYIVHQQQQQQQQLHTHSTSVRLCRPLLQRLNECHAWGLRIHKFPHFPLLRTSIRSLFVCRFLLAAALSVVVRSRILSVHISASWLLLGCQTLRLARVCRFVNRSSDFSYTRGL